MSNDKPTVNFTYKNHNNKTAVRTVTVEVLEYLTEPGFGYSPGWFVSGWCHDKCARRSFALSNIVLPTGDKFKFYKLLVL